MTAPRPGRANYVLWLVLSLPAATVVAGLWTLWLAAGDSAIDANPDAVRRTAQVQVASVDSDETAARDGLRARVDIAGDGSVVVSVTPAAGPVAPVLQLVHPIESSLDRVIVLRPGPAGWRGDAPLTAEHAWRLRLVAGDGRWRLVGRWRPGDTTVRLEPAVAVP